MFDLKGSFLIESKMLEITDLPFSERRKQIAPVRILKSELKHTESTTIFIGVILETTKGYVFSLELKSDEGGMFTLDHGLIELLFKPEDAYEVGVQISKVETLSAPESLPGPRIELITSLNLLMVTSKISSTGFIVIFKDISSKRVVCSEFIETEMTEPVLSDVWVNEEHLVIHQAGETELQFYLGISETQADNRCLILMPFKIAHNRSDQSSSRISALG